MCLLIPERPELGRKAALPVQAAAVERCACEQTEAVQGSPTAAAHCCSRQGVPEGHAVSEAMRVSSRVPVELKELAGAFLWHRGQVLAVVRAIFSCAQVTEIELATFGCTQVSALACVSVVVVPLLHPRV